MNIPEIYREVDSRKYRLTGGGALFEHLLVLVLSSAFSSPGSAVCPGSSKAFYRITFHKNLLDKT